MKYLTIKISGILFLILSIFIFSFTANSQSRKTVLVTNTPSIVPIGKKWYLLANTETAIQVSDNTFSSNNACSFIFSSINKNISTIRSGNYYKGELYGINFINLKKVPYTNAFTYLITPISFLNLNLYSTREYSNDTETGKSAMIKFIQGEHVFVDECLQSIELFETNMTNSDYQEYNEIKRKEQLNIEAKNKENEERKKYEEESKMRDQEIRRKENEERKQGIINSSVYINGSDLSNSNQIIFQIDSIGLKLLCEYVEESKLNTNTYIHHLNDFYTVKEELINQNKEKFQYYASFYFDTTKQLKEVGFGFIYTQNEKYYDTSILSLLIPHITLNKCGTMILEDKIYPTKFAINCSLDYRDTDNKCQMEIHKNKKGQIKIITTGFYYSIGETKNNINKVAKKLEENETIKDLEEGEYLITGRFIKAEYKLQNNYNMIAQIRYKEVIKSRGNYLQTDFIQKIIDKKINPYIKEGVTGLAKKTPMRLFIRY